MIKLMIKLFKSLLLVMSPLLMSNTLGLQLAFCEESPVTSDTPLIDAQGDKTGHLRLIQTEKGVKLSLKINSIPPGQYNIHFHESGVCIPPGFESTGKHTLSSHAGQELQPDLTLRVGPNSRVNSEFETKRFTLDKGKQAILKNDSSSIVIYAAPKKNLLPQAQKTYPGKPFACGVIAKNEYIPSNYPWFNVKDTD
jgi:Cu-Zn family superoxide dismutase